MSIVNFKPSARQDLLEIEEFIAEDNLTTAKAFVDMMQQKCYVLAEFPQMGTSRENLRMHPVGDDSSDGWKVEFGPEGVQARRHHAVSDHVRQTEFEPLEGSRQPVPRQ